jgi:hypothetical protein
MRPGSTGVSPVFLKDMAADSHFLIDMVPRAFIIVFGICASFLIYWITVWGPGVSPDSIIYLQTAKSLLSGKGFYVDNKPMTHYPPTYPLMLAAVGYFYQGDLIQAGRLLNAIFFGANIILLGYAVQLCTKNNFIAIASITVFFFTSATVFTSHSMLWSEPPFISLTLAFLIFISLYVISPKPYLLIAVSVAMGLALTTCYIGVILLSTATLSLLILGDRDFKKKMIDIFLAVTIASLPLAILLWRNFMVAQSATNRSLVIHPIDYAQIHSMLATIVNFTMPISIHRIFNIVILFFIILLFIFAVVYVISNNYLLYKLSPMSSIFSKICLIFSSSYLLVLFLTISLFDASIPLDNRILLPGFLPVVLVLILTGWCFSEINKKKVFYHIFLFCYVILVIVN